MSLVTNIILCLGADETEHDDIEDHPARYASVALDRLQALIAPAQLVRVDHMVEGPKCMECEVWIAAVNYLDIEAFVAAVRAAPWLYREEVNLLMKEFLAEAFTLRFDGRTD